MEIEDSGVGQRGFIIAGDQSTVGNSNQDLHPVTGGDVREFRNRSSEEIADWERDIISDFL